MGSLDTPGYAYGVDIVGNTAYVADGWEGLYLVNVTDPAHPIPVSSYKTPGWAFDIVVSDNLAYVANAFRELQIVDVSDPMHLKKAGGEEVWGGLVRNVAVDGGIAGFNNRIQGNLASGNPDTEVSAGDYGGCCNVVVGNLIGTDASGTRAIPNGYGGGGLSIGGAFNRIERNVVSGKDSGIDVSGAGGVGNLVIGNFIGTDVTGNAAIGNQGVGIRVVTWLGGAEHNMIQGNIIAHTTFSEQDGSAVGILVDSYPHNTIRRNSIHSNAGKGIVTSNGGNNMSPAPVITTVTEMSISGTACPGCIVEIFSDEEDEGRIYEGSAIANTAGLFILNKSSPVIGPSVTATATDSDSNTSEFSEPWLLGQVKIYLPLILRN